MKTKTHFIKSKVKAVAFIVLLISVGISSCKKDKTSDPDNNPPGTVAYSGSFVKSKDNVTTSATGTTTATFNTSTRELSYTLTWTGLSSNAMEMHFHDAGPIIVAITGFPNAMAGTVSGKATLTVEQANDLAAGKIYSQIHSQTYPGGEIIATLTKKSTSNTGGGGGYDY